MTWCFWNVCPLIGIVVGFKGPYTNIDISWVNAKFGTTADWMLKHIMNNATYFKNFVAMKRRDNLNCCKNIKTKWPQNSWNRLRWVNSCDSGIDPRSRIFTKMIFLRPFHLAPIRLPWELNGSDTKPAIAGAVLINGSRYQLYRSRFFGYRLSFPAPAPRAEL